MAGPKKGTGSGTKFELSTDGNIFKKFMSVTKVTPPEYTRDTVDLTDNSSYDDNNQMKESGVGFIDPGELKVEGFVHTEDEGLTLASTAFFDGTEVKGKVVSPAWMNKTLTYAGIITSLQPLGELDPENGVPYSMTMKITAKPVESKTTGG